MKGYTRRTGLRWLGATAASLAVAAATRKPQASPWRHIDASGDGFELEDMSNLAISNPPVALPPLSFQAADGSAHTLAEFAGRGMVLNFWATWCVPCGAEMPALDHLSRTLAPHDIAVLPLSSDRGGAEAVRGFYAANKIGALPVLLDPQATAARSLGLRGIPTTLLINGKGQECARLTGAANWATDTAVATIRRLLS